MHVPARSFSLAAFLAILPLFCLGATAAFAQSPPGSAAPADAPSAATAQPPAPASAAPPGNAEVPAYAPPPGYGAQPAYPPPEYYPPPGYMPPPGYYPPPGYPPPGAYYPPPPSGPPPGHHEHDGFYMRLCMGLGYLHTSDSYQGQTETVSGPGLGMDMAFGAAVARNLLVFGDLSMTVASEPTWKYAGTSDTLTNTTVTLLGMGPGIAYYLEPLNLYFSGSVQLSHVTSDNTSSSSNASQEVTDYGFGASFMAGKEWWVSSNWGLGAAALLHLASMKMKDYDTRMSATAFSILFSATFN